MRRLQPLEPRRRRAELGPARRLRLRRRLAQLRGRAPLLGGELVDPPGRGGLRLVREI